jgi:S1-C subfamily serine protease
MRQSIQAVAVVPLVDDQGMVLGINTTKFTGGSAEGPGFAIAADDAHAHSEVCLRRNRDGFQPYSNRRLPQE